MLKQMCWLSMSGSSEEKVLHLRTHLNQPWQPYMAFPAYAVPDYPIPGGSKGWSTYQKLMHEGWSLITNAQVEEWLSEQERKSA